MRAAEDSTDFAVARARLAFDPKDGLAREPRLVVDPRLLGALHAELEARLGSQDAADTLLHLGFLHGLRDSLRVVRGGWSGTTPSAPPAAPLLPMRLEPQTGSGVPALELRGSWPERNEAAARLAQLGGATTPSCFLSAGYTSGWLSGLLGADLLAAEEECAACGGASCRFVVREPGEWQASGQSAVAARARALPFAEIRALVEHDLAAGVPAPGPPERFDSAAPLIHVWGPVMVLPFCGPDESLQAVELIGRDPAAREVAVVVVDLTGAVIDEGFGALGLEQTLDVIEAWGAEPVLAGVSPLSERVVAELEHAHLVVRKDLPQAIAAAFVIAQAQQRLV